MIKRLRTRFIAIMMSIIFIMFIIVFTAIALFTRYNLRRNSQNLMEVLAESPIQRTNIFKRPSDTGLPYFIVEVSLSGKVNTVFSESYDTSDIDTLYQVVNSVVNSDSQTGYLPLYKLRFYKTVTMESYKVVFVDISSEFTTMRLLIRNMIIIGILSMHVFFIISMLWSKWAVKPVENAWNQQKQFISDASHELKTPITVITTNAELLQAPEITEEEKNKYSENILTVSRSMKVLVEDLLNIARLENGKEINNYEDFCVSDVINDEVLTFEPLFYEAGLTLTENIENNIFIHGSESRIKQVFDIFLDNAMKYSDAGNVIISLKRSGKSAILSVSNPGEPLTDTQRVDIFKRFYRVDESRSEKGSYGLGLSIAKAIAESHKGTVSAESQSGYNTFIFKVPVI